MFKACDGVLNAVNPGRYEYRDLLEVVSGKGGFVAMFEYIGLEAFAGMMKVEQSNGVLSTAWRRELGIGMSRVEGGSVDL